MRVLVLGITGMLGSMLFRYFGQSGTVDVVGTVRGGDSPDVLRKGNKKARILFNIDVLQSDALEVAIGEARPDVVINCIGLVKQLQEATIPVRAVQVNALLPHQLHSMCTLLGARLIHVSTDCVFSGATGLYREGDIPDATDLYGRSKLLGEVGGEGAVTLRTSIIGPEIATNHGLFEWFMSQTGTAQGYRQAIFSGVPTVELGRIILDHVIPNARLNGAYHVAAAPIDKYSLLSLIRDEYGKEIRIVPNDQVRIDRSLDASRFNSATGYRPPDWPALIKTMKTWDFRDR